MALLKCSYAGVSYACVNLLWRQQYACVSARPRRRTGVAGGACAEQGAHEKRGMAATAFPPQNFKAAISPCKHFLFV